MVIFHNTECGNKGNKLNSCFIIIKSFPLRPHRLSLRGCHVMNEQLEKPEDSKQVN